MKTLPYQQHMMGNTGYLHMLEGNIILKRDTCNLIKELGLGWGFNV